MDVVPVNNKSDGLLIGQEIGGRTSSRQKGIDDSIRQGIAQKDLTMDTWYLNIGNQPDSRMYVRVNG